MITTIPTHAITVHRPFPEAMLSQEPGWKDIENRSWPLGSRFRNVPIALHAAKHYAATAAWHMERMGHFTPEDEQDSPRGIVGIVVFGGVIDDADRKLVSPWRTNARFAWCISDRLALPTPIPCPGRQGLWKLDDRQRGAIGAQLDCLAQSRAKESADTLIRKHGLSFTLNPGGGCIYLAGSSEQVQIHMYDHVQDLKSLIDWLVAIGLEVSP